MDTIAQLDRKIEDARSALCRHQARMARRAWIRGDLYREERAVAELTDRLERLAETREHHRRLGGLGL